MNNFEIGDMVKWGNSDEERTGIFKRMISETQAEIKSLTYRERPMIVLTVVNVLMLTKTAD
jgi:hypothetical protein